MGHTLKKVKGRESGLTLVELVITILILAILVGLVMLTMAFSRRAQEATCKVNLRTLFSSINEYQALHNGDYPPNLDVLITEHYLKSTFTFKCPSGNYGTKSGDYRDYYNPTTGTVSCPRASHNP